MPGLELTPASMRTEQEIFDKIKATLVDLFEIDAAKIVPEASLYQDLDIDSIDAIDLILQLKSYTGRKIDPEQFKHVRTVKDLVGAVQQLLAEPPPTT
jgi:acyl carrier protein